MWGWVWWVAFQGVYAQGYGGIGTIGAFQEFSINESQPQIIRTLLAAVHISAVFESWSRVIFLVWQ